MVRGDWAKHDRQLKSGRGRGEMELRDGGRGRHEKKLMEPDEVKGRQRWRQLRE